MKYIHFPLWIFFILTTIKSRDFWSGRVIGYFYENVTSTITQKSFWAYSNTQDNQGQYIKKWTYHPDYSSTTSYQFSTTGPGINGSFGELLVTYLPNNIMFYNQDQLISQLNVPQVQKIYQNGYLTVYYTPTRLALLDQNTSTQIYFDFVCLGSIHEVGNEIMVFIVNENRIV